MKFKKTHMMNEAEDKNCMCHPQWHGEFVQKLLLTFLGILLVYIIVYVGTLIRNNIQAGRYIGQADKMERTIMVTGVGKVSANNDIAMTTIGYSNTDKDVAKAQADNKKVMDQLFAELKKMGIEDKDLQTNYTIYPDYTYTQDKGQELKGYRVSQEVSVKIRDLSKISAVLGLAGKYGATEVGGLSFSIDDTENLKASARAKSVEDAKKKAAVLAATLGARLGSVVSYNEFESSNYQPVMMKTYALDVGMGGGAPTGPEAVAGGSKDVVVNTNITYEIISE